MLNLESIIHYRVDAIIFACVIFTATLLTHWWLIRKHQKGIPLTAWGLMSATVVLGFVTSEIAGEKERDRLRDMLSGIAPTYAQEMEILGLNKVNLKTDPNDPVYLSLINAEIRWEKVNPNISDIYTFTKNDDGKVAFLVDSETDYNHSGKYDEDREQRTAIGEEYSEATESMLKTLDDIPSFDGVPYTDKWGTWVSAYVPIHDANGKVTSALGVDYDARAWVGAIFRNRLGALGLVIVLAVGALSATTIVMITRAELVKRARLEKEREQLQEQLMQASRQAGMAEIATGVLHNVGNVLNSVNVSARVVSDGIRSSRLASLGKLSSIISAEKSHLGEFVTTDPRGKCLPEFLEQLHAKMKEDQDNIQNEVDQLLMGVDHIKEVVRMQQNCATNSSNVLTPIDPTSIMEDAIKVNLIAMERHHIELVRLYQPGMQNIALDKHKIMQILINLINNAKKATCHPEINHRKISLGIKVDEASNQVRFWVTDNGVGIKSEEANRLFQHGFTTFKEGHGFGLHSGANAATEMKGSLTCQSDGPLKGATFTLALPIHTAVTEGAGA